MQNAMHMLTFSAPAMRNAFPCIFSHSRVNFPCAAAGAGASVLLRHAPGDSFLSDPGGYESIIAHP